jgi:two-component system sensor histidine kinase UhpB
MDRTSPATPRGAFIAFIARLPQALRQTTTFEQVLLANSVIIVVSTLLAYGVTHAVVEPYHFLFDTLFVLGATVLGVSINVLVLRRTFRPLFAMLATIKAIEAGATGQRVSVVPAATDIIQVATAFNGMLDALDAHRQARLREVAAAQEAERRHIALELHDATGQELTALLLHLEVIAQDLAEPEPDLMAIRAEVATATAQAQRTLRGVQALAQQLRPAVLDDLGLAAALAWLVDELRARATISLTFTSDTRPCLAPLAETMLFRVAQEALANALRHSGAQHITLALTQAGRNAQLTISDDGHGFDLGDIQRGMGLTSMHERMTLIGGTLDVQTVLKGGTRIRATVPVAEGGTRDG